VVDVESFVFEVVGCMEDVLQESSEYFAAEYEGVGAIKVSGTPNEGFSRDDFWLLEMLPAEIHLIPIFR
jgi:hypothetical protein